MKTVILLFLLLWSCNAMAQNSRFVRVFDLKGKRINSGRVTHVTDTAITLEHMGVPVIIPVTTIGFIKTKRAAGNNILVGSVIGLVTMAVVGAASAEPDAIVFAYDAGAGAGMGAIAGLPLGAALGGLTALGKNPKRYSIKGDGENWQAFKVIFADKKNKKDRSLK